MSDGMRERFDKFMGDQIAKKGALYAASPPVNIAMDYHRALLDEASAGAAPEFSEADFYLRSVANSKDRCYHENISEFLPNRCTAIAAELDRRAERILALNNEISIITGGVDGTATFPIPSTMAWCNRLFRSPEGMVDYPSLGRAVYADISRATKRATDRAASIEAENAQLRAEVARLRGLIRTAAQVGQQAAGGKASFDFNEWLAKVDELCAALESQAPQPADVAPSEPAPASVPLVESAEAIPDSPWATSQLSRVRIHLGSEPDGSCLAATVQCLSEAQAHALASVLSTATMPGGGR